MDGATSLLRQFPESVGGVVFAIAFFGILFRISDEEEVSIFGNEEKDEAIDDAEGLAVVVLSAKFS